MRWVFALLVSLFMVGCSTLDVNVDYDEAFNFSTVKSFTVVHNVQKGENSLVNDRITAAIESELEKKGYVKTTHNADLVFVYHYNAKDKVDIRTDYQMVGYGSFGYGGAMIARTNAYNYTEGTIIIDALNPKTKKIVWRSVGTLELQKKETPQEKREYVNKIIKEMLEKYPKKSLS